MCAASAASTGYKPWQAAQPARQVSQAFAQAVVSAPEAVYRAIEQPAAKAVAVAKTTGTAFADKEANAAILRSETDVAADGFNYM